MIQYTQLKVSRDSEVRTLCPNLVFSYKHICKFFDFHGMFSWDLNSVIIYDQKNNIFHQIQVYLRVMLPYVVYLTGVETWSSPNGATRPLPRLLRLEVSVPNEFTVTDVVHMKIFS